MKKNKSIETVLRDHDRDVRSVMISREDSNPMFRLIHRLALLEGLKGFQNHERELRELLSWWPMWQIEGMWQDDERREFKANWWKKCHNLHRWIKRRMKDLDQDLSDFPEFVASR